MSRKTQTAVKKTNSGPVYLDCNATTPIEPAVLATLHQFLDEEYGNEGSRTHEFGARAKKFVQRARDQIAAVVGTERENVLFTSGATESNNLAILGLSAFGVRTGRKHILSTAIEHHAILEPLDELKRRGFEITLVPPNSGGWIEPEKLLEAMRPDTLLVSVMHANNETGIVQPIAEIAAALGKHSAFFHVDAAQTFGKLIEPLRTARIDLISMSGHKIYGPKGIGALVARRRGFDRIPLNPISFGGGQERGLRPGTLPVPLIVAFGVAADLALRDHAVRTKRCLEFRKQIESALRPFIEKIHGDCSHALAHVINLSLTGLDSEAVMVALKTEIALSNGSACTSASYKPSHVLKAMGLSDDGIRGALRFSWCHLTPDIDWTPIVDKIRLMMS